MKLCVDNDWLRRQIGNDPIADAEAGRVIRRSADVVKAAEAAAQPQAVAVAGAPKRGTRRSPCSST